MGRAVPYEVDHSNRDCFRHPESHWQIRYTRRHPYGPRLITELTRLCGIEHSFATAYSSEENGIVERANQEVLRHLRAFLFGSRVHDKWSFEQLPLVQRIMNTVEKTSTGVTPADLILSHSIRLSSHIMTPIGDVDSSDTMDLTKAYTTDSSSRDLTAERPAPSGGERS